MSEKKLRVLTSTAIAASLFLMTADGSAAERTRRQAEESRSFEAAEGRWEFQIWRFLPRLWQRAVSQTDLEGSTDKARSHMDPNGLAEKARSHMDPNG